MLKRMLFVGVACACASGCGSGKLDRATALAKLREGYANQGIPTHKFPMTYRFIVNPGADSMLYDEAVSAGWLNVKGQHTDWTGNVLRDYEPGSNLADVEPNGSGNWMLVIGKTHQVIDEVTGIADEGDGKASVEAHMTVREDLTAAGERLQKFCERVQNGTMVCGIVTQVSEEHSKPKAIPFIMKMQRFDNGWRMIPGSAAAAQ